MAISLVDIACMAKESVANKVEIQRRIVLMFWLALRNLLFLCLPLPSLSLKIFAILGSRRSTSKIAHDLAEFYSQTNAQETLLAPVDPQGKCTGMVLGLIKTCFYFVFNSQEIYDLPNLINGGQ